MKSTFQDKITNVRKFFSRLHNNWQDFKKNVSYLQNKKTKEWSAAVEYNEETIQGAGKTKLQAFAKICENFAIRYTIDFQTNRIMRWPMNS